MKSIFKKYLWLFEWIGAAVILAMGIIIVAQNEIIYVIVGLALFILGVFRVVPLLKTTSDKLLASIYFIEILANVAIGITLIVIGVKQTTGIGKTLGYLMGSVLYLRGLVYFFANIMRDEETDKTQFITSVIVFTLGTMVISAGLFGAGIDANVLAWIVFAIAVISALFIIFSGVKNYRNYRYEFASEKVTKKKTVKEKKGVELPAEQKDEVIIPEKEEKTPVIEPEEKEKPSINA
ncbi:MAG: hypothetical protein PHT83_00335 [Bacilli bacterium]|nr:hypothetical protein [Bacilli bacterium]